MSRQLRFGAFMRPTTIHTGAWRYPGAYPDANFNVDHLKEFAQTLERALRQQAIARMCPTPEPSLPLGSTTFPALYASR
ncbi:hypothetical protein OKW47_007704 [Paraburkholderia atlantica]